jgi:hypothetical protein
MDDLDHPKGRDDLMTLSEKLRRPLRTLYVLSSGNDPYMTETPSRRESARWFAELYTRFKIKFGVHLRAILYVLVSQPVGDVLLPNGDSFENTPDNYDDLCSAGRDARFLDLIPECHHRPPQPGTDDQSSGR